LAFLSMSAAAAPVVGLLHPGNMGSEVGRCLVRAGVRTVWASEGRSEQTKARAASAELEDMKTLKALLEVATVVLSVCPPGNAHEVAMAVQQTGWKGLYVDANAIAVSTSEKIASLFPPSSYVDGGIIGPPPTKPNLCRLYLSGQRADEVARLFAGPGGSGCLLTPMVMEEGPGGVAAASALKMAYAAWTKGSNALLLNVRALAEKTGVGKALEAEWALSQPTVGKQAQSAAAGTGPKAWRFVGEMEEIASSFREAGLADQFHVGAAEVYGRLAPLRGREQTPPSLDEALALVAEKAPKL